MKKILVFICLALCLVLFVCSCGGSNNTDTNTDTGSSIDTDTSLDTSTDTDSDVNSDTDTDSGVDLNDGKYRVFVCDEDGNAIEGIYVQYCSDEICNFGATDKNGYFVVPSGEYHIASATDENGIYNDIVYSEADYLHFEEGSALITITMTKK